MWRLVKCTKENLGRNVISDAKQVSRQADILRAANSFLKNGKAGVVIKADGKILKYKWECDS